MSSNGMIGMVGKFQDTSNKGAVFFIKAIANSNTLRVILVN